MARKTTPRLDESGIMALPVADFIGPMSVEQALRLRRTVREFGPAPLKLTEVSQLLWAAQGITGAGGLRTTPSAGELYPLEVYLIAAAVDGLPAGLYGYTPTGHRLQQRDTRDLRAELAAAALDQQWVKVAPAIIVLAAAPERTTKVFGERGHRYVLMETAMAAENLHLQAASLGLGLVTVAAFDDEVVKRILGLPAEQMPLCLNACGNLA